VQYLVGTPRGVLDAGWEKAACRQALATTPGRAYKSKLLPQDGELYVFAPKHRTAVAKKGRCAVAS